MRINGTKYPKISKLPPNAQPVSQFAHDLGIAVGQVYIKYERFKTGKSKLNPKYCIRCFMGSNFVIPDKIEQ